MSESPQSNHLSPSSDVIIETKVITCPLCHGNDFRHVVTAQDPQWGISGTFRVVACQSCGHRYMNPAPTAESLSSCYPTEYGPHQNLPQIGEQQNGTSEVDGSVQAPSPRPWYLRWIPLRKVPGLRHVFYWLMDDKSQLVPQFPQDLQAGQGSPSCRAFELGCAAGAYLQKLRAIGCEVEGLEPGSAAAATAARAGLNVAQGTLDDHTYPSDHYDWIALWMVLEHVPDPRQTLEDLFHMQAEGGTLALSVPNAGCWESKVFRRYWDAWDLPRHLQHFRPTTIRRLLEEVGYADINVQHQPNFLNVMGSIGVWWTSLVPNSRVGQWFRTYPHRPRMWLQLLTAPVAHALAFLNQGGRLTVTAKKTSGEQITGSSCELDTKQD